MQTHSCKIFNFVSKQIQSNTVQCNTIQRKSILGEKWVGETPLLVATTLCPSKGQVVRVFLSRKEEETQAPNHKVIRLHDGDIKQRLGT